MKVTFKLKKVTLQFYLTMPSPAKLFIKIHLKVKNKNTQTNILSQIIKATIKANKAWIYNLSN
jgi:hypothetical protein